MQLKRLSFGNNQITLLPEWLGDFRELEWLHLSNNSLSLLPDFVFQFSHLKTLFLYNIHLSSLSPKISNLNSIEYLRLGYNELTELPTSLAQLEHLKTLNLDDNPLNPELAEAYKQGVEGVKAYLRAKATGAQITLNEAKLILVGEGEVGKSCLLSALRGEEFVEGLPTTHGIEIKEIEVTDPESKKGITLNGWDFGGQRVYRPTHQLFFSSPAVYLVVWKPREGSQAGQIKDWIRLVKHRELEAKIIVVATHGGPNQRQPDIDRQELWDLFGKDTLIDFLPCG